MGKHTIAVINNISYAKLYLVESHPTLAELSEYLLVLRKAKVVLNHPDYWAKECRSRIVGNIEAYSIDGAVEEAWKHVGRSHWSTAFFWGFLERFMPDLTDKDKLQAKYVAFNDSPEVGYYDIQVLLDCAIKVVASLLL